MIEGKKKYYIGDVLQDRTGHLYQYPAIAGKPAENVVSGKGRKYLVIDMTPEGWLELETVTKSEVLVRLSQKKTVTCRMRGRIQADVNGIHQNRFKRVFKSSTKMEVVPRKPYPVTLDWRKEAARRYEEATNWRYQARRRYQQKCSQEG